jgi:aspartate/methionine/tyrosine aminotransferase
MELAKEAAGAGARRPQHHPHGNRRTRFHGARTGDRSGHERLRRGVTQYTSALGLASLREAIAGHYRRPFGLSIDPARIVVTAGASAALLLACTALVDRDDEVLMPDPCYPCNRHFVAAAEGKPVLVPSGPAERFQLTAARCKRLWTPLRAACCWRRRQTRPVRPLNRTN